MIGILSVTYKESFEESALYKSLNSIPDDSPFEYKVFNFYNASEVNQTFVNQGYTEEETIENGGLALGYNAGMDFFSNYPEVEYLLFLNSDCELTGEILNQYICLISEKNIDFLYPKLVCNKTLVSPFRKPGFDYDFYIIAWLLVKKSKLENYTFDASYWLDGIDYEFSVWLKEMGLIGKAMSATFNHDLSVITSYRLTPEWRILNIYKTEKLFLIKGFNFILFKGVLRAMVNNRLKLSFRLVKLFFVST